MKEKERNRSRGMDRESLIASFDLWGQGGARLLKGTRERKAAQKGATDCATGVTDRRKMTGKVVAALKRYKEITHPELAAHTSWSGGLVSLYLWLSRNQIKKKGKGRWRSREKRRDHERGQMRKER